MSQNPTIPTSLAPWLSVHDSLKALAFYKSAFGATEVYRMDVPGGVIARLSVNGAEFWLGHESEEKSGSSHQVLGGGSVRMILTVSDPDSFFTNALKSGAIEIFPVGESHGCRLGRLADPFGLHWEIGRPL